RGRLMIVFGTQTYGKVDQVPGLFYVATAFFHVQFVPLVPSQSYLMIDDGAKRGIPIHMSGKSVGLAYLRVFLLLVGIIFPICGIISLADSKRQEHFLESVLFVALGVVVLGLFWMTYRSSHATRERAAYLAECAGLDPSFVHDYFDRKE